MIRTETPQEHLRNALQIIEGALESAACSQPGLHLRPAELRGLCHRIATAINQLEGRTP